MNQPNLAQVANLGETSGGINNHQQVPLSRNTVSVQSSGEIWSNPDILQFIVTIKNSKESLEEAQTSVKRRTDYISQVIRKNSVKSENIVMYTDVTPAGTNGAPVGVDGHVGPGPSSQSMLATVYTEVVVTCDCMGRCETIRNMLIEKLDTSVDISPISYWHSAEAKETGR